jgi:uncharacterized protein YbjT (DUF2867 family)
MILVVGGTGDLGRRVVQRLRARGAPVRCLVRPGTVAGDLSEAETVPGDLTDAESLATACAGADTVVCTATAISRLMSGSGGPSLRKVDQDGVLQLVDAAESAGVDHFVYVSYAGVDAGLGFPLERAKMAVEQRLFRSPMVVTVVRPDAFQEIHLGPVGRFDIRAGKVAVFGDGTLPHRWVGTDDVAQLVAALTTAAAAPRVVGVGGPEAISRNRAIEVVEEVLHRRMRRQAAPLMVARVGMRLMARPKPALASILGIGVLQATVASTWDDAPLREHGISPTSATEFLRGQAKALGEP